MPTALTSVTGSPTSASQNIQIVNHQIVDDVNIEATRSENAEAMHFEKERTIENRFNGEHGGMNLSTCPTCKFAMRRADFDKCICFRKIRSHWFFQQVRQFPLLHQAAADLGVRNRGTATLAPSTAPRRASSEANVCVPIPRRMR